MNIEDTANMEYDEQFILFCEEECDMYYYLRYLLDPLSSSQFFDYMYNDYIESKQIIITNRNHYALCKFYAFEHFYDESGPNRDDNTDRGLKNAHFYY